MDIAIILLLLMWLGLVLAWGVMSVVQNLTGKTAYDEPAFRERVRFFTITAHSS
jgi:hypothetical protein